ncbi:DUF6461 domain-containing protein [Mycobacterium sp. NPDC006124]|uniref:DUF6461 domain-containing protein n=1 Tax=Mycobacterium sp. NPDC006124 TaxID=3156729 RepID=UPI0033B15B9D
MDDYSWWPTWRPGWAEAHCVTLVGDLGVDDLIEALQARRVTMAAGFDALYAHVVANWPAGYDPSVATVGVAAIDERWTLVAEVNGFLGVTEDLVGPLSCERTVVSHFANVNAVHTFHWWRDGRLLVDVDLMFPSERSGSDPDALVDHARAVGIPLDAEEILTTVDLSAAGFALAESVTGVALTPEWLTGTSFHVVTVTT